MCKLFLSQVILWFAFLVAVLPPSQSQAAQPLGNPQAVILLQTPRDHDSASTRTPAGPRAAQFGEEPDRRT